MKEYFLTILRDRKSDLETFRTASASISRLIASEISQQIQLKKTTVQAPEGLSDGARPNQRIILIPILRAGLALLPAFLELFKDAPIGFIGISRDEETAIPALYYINLPKIGARDQILLLDPMLATGGSANLALDLIKDKGGSPAEVTLVTLIAAKPGIHAVEKRHSEVRIYTVGIDEKLNAKKFIVPGLGDFGDRFFGTD